MKDRVVRKTRPVISTLIARKKDDDDDETWIVEAFANSGKEIRSKRMFTDNYDDARKYANQILWKPPPVEQ